MLVTGVVKRYEPRAPAMLVFRSIVDQQQHARAGKAFHQAIEQRLRLTIDPVEIFEDEPLPASFRTRRRISYPLGPPRRSWGRRSSFSALQRAHFIVR